MMPRVLCAVIAAWPLAMASAPAHARETRLVLTSMSPAGSTNSVFFNDWARRVNADSQGTIKVEVKDGFSLANYANVYDRVQSDVVQIGWALPVSLGNQFPLTSVVALPFNYRTAEDGSAALWRLYKSGQLARELQDVVPLWMSASPQAALHFRRAPKSPSDLSGLKVNVVAGKVQSDMVAALGGQPMSLQLSEAYEALQRGTIDGALIGWSAVHTFKMHEVTSYHVNVGLGGSAHLFFMSKRKFNQLPAAARAALEKHSGEVQSVAFGRMLEGEATKALALANTLPGQKVVDLTVEQQQAMESKAATLTKAWASTRAGGDKALATYRSLLAAINAETSDR